MLNFILICVLFLAFKPYQPLCSDFPSCDEICASLEKDFYVMIPYDVPRPLMKDSVEAFLQFLNTDSSVKEHLQSLLPGNHRRRELGFSYRDATNNTDGENKNFFHYHPYLLKEHSRFISLNPTVSHFITHVDEVWNLVAEAAKQVLTRLDERFPGVYDEVFNTEEPHIVLRIVHYQASPHQEILARPHFDAGSFTLAIAESAPGLRIGSKQENLMLVPYEENSIIFMLGKNCRKLIPSETLLPGWHDVVRLDRLDMRWAIVAFIDGHHVEGPSREETHQLDN